MRPGIRVFVLSFPILAMIACATGQDIPEEGSALEAQVGGDAGRPTGSIRPEAGAPSTTTTDTDAGKPSAHDAGATESDAAALPETAPPVTPPTPPVCDSSNPKYGVTIIALALTGTTPPLCIGGACNSGECCYNAQYCLPE